MSWPYHFLDLTSDQKHQRRQLLDYYGSLARASILVPLLVIQLFFIAAWIHRKWQSDFLDPPSSPYAKEKRHGRKVSSRNLKTTFQSLVWWCGDPIRVFDCHLGTKGEVLGAAIWAVWLLSLCLTQTGEDYLHLTKRFGIVASSQLPLQYLLALKSPYSPLQLLTRSSHETLNSLHQLLGRIITALLYLHTALYINFFVQSNLFADKLTQPYILCGIFGTIAFTAVGTTALSPIRKWSYKVFYIIHVSLATALLPVLFFHVTHIRLYLYETAIVYGLNAILRTIATRTYTGTIRIIPNTNLLEIDIPLSEAGAAKGGALQRWEPGQHAYLSLAGHPLLRTFRSNPFTVASIPTVDGNLRFVARILDGNTAKLAQTASAGAKATQRLTVEGPYGVATHADRLLRYDRILFVAGGVGATFIVPLYRQLLADLSPSKGSYRRQKVSFRWAVRSQAEMAWALPADAKEREGFLERLNVHVTGRKGDLADGSFVMGIGNDDDRPYGGGMEDGIELEEQENLLSSADHGSPTSPNKAGADGIPIVTGRPSLPKLIDQTLSHGGISSTEKIAIVVCGPRSLNQALRKEVSRHVHRGREVWFWEESFAF